MRALVLSVVLVGLLWGTEASSSKNMMGVRGTTAVLHQRESKATAAAPAPVPAPTPAAAADPAPVASARPRKPNAIQREMPAVPTYAGPDPGRATAASGTAAAPGAASGAPAPGRELAAVYCPEKGLQKVIDEPNLDLLSVFSPDRAVAERAPLGVLDMCCDKGIRATIDTLSPRPDGAAIFSEFLRPDFLFGDVKKWNQNGTPLQKAKLCIYVGWRRHLVRQLVTKLRQEHCMDCVCKAEGSEKLESDLDVTCNGWNVDVMVRNFNQMMSTRFGETSAKKFDTNIYGDAITTRGTLRMFPRVPPPPPAAGAQAAVSTDFEMPPCFKLKDEADRTADNPDDLLFKYATDAAVISKSHEFVFAKVIFYLRDFGNAVGYRGCARPTETCPPVEAFYEKLRNENSENSRDWLNSELNRQFTAARQLLNNLLSAPCAAHPDACKDGELQMDNVRARNAMYETKLSAVFDKIRPCAAPGPDCRRITPATEAAECPQLMTSLMESRFYADESYYVDGTLIAVLDRIQGGKKVSLNAHQLFDSTIENFADVVKETSHFFHHHKLPMLGDSPNFALPSAMTGEAVFDYVSKASKYVFRFTLCAEELGLTGSTLDPARATSAAKLRSVYVGPAHDKSTTANYFACMSDQFALMQTNIRGRALSKESTNERLIEWVSEIRTVFKCLRQATKKETTEGEGIDMGTVEAAAARALAGQFAPAKTLRRKGAIITTGGMSVHEIFTMAFERIAADVIKFYYAHLRPGAQEAPRASASGATRPSTAPSAAQRVPGPSQATQPKLMVVGHAFSRDEAADKARK